VYYRAKIDSQFTGNAIQVSGCFDLPAGAGVDAWVGLSNGQLSGVWGWDVSLSVGTPGLAGSIIVSNAIPAGDAIYDTFNLAGLNRYQLFKWYANHIKNNDGGNLNGFGLFACRVLEQCGRTHPKTKVARPE
jgi:hypothetical protein